MEVKNIKSWNEFEDELDKIGQLKSDEGVTYGNLTFLFRGQSNAEWPLSTTLERVMGDNKIDMWRYYYLMSNVKNRIETFTGNSWPLPNAQ